MNGPRAIWIAAAILVMSAAPSATDSQEPAPKRDTTQDSGVVLRQTVRGVRVDVVVTDANGRPVTGLKASDFRVAEDGKPQPIRQFEYHSEGDTEDALPKRPPLPPHTFMNLPEARERGPLTVVLYDVLNTPLDDQSYARDQLLEFLKKSTGRRIAVFVLGDQLRLLQGFTSDVDVLTRAVNRAGAASLFGYRAELAGDPMRRNAVVSQGRILPADRRMQEIEENGRLSDARDLLERRVSLTVEAFAEISHFLAGVPGRKNLIWFSGAFPIAIVPTVILPLENNQKVPGAIKRDDSSQSFSNTIRQVASLLNSAEVAVYPVDARGLQTYTATTFERLSADIGTLKTVAEETGGRAFYNTNGLKGALETAAEDGSSYYSLLYAPTNMKFDGSVRRISVHVAHGHYQLAYRRSYYADDLESKAKRQTAPSAEDAPSEFLEDQTRFGAPPSRQIIFAAHLDPVGTAVPATPEQAKALAEYPAQSARSNHQRVVSPSNPVQMQQYTIRFGLLASQLEFPKSSDGIYHLQISVVALAYDASGEALWGTRSRINDAIPGPKMKGVRENGLEVQLTFFAPTETAVIRLAVCDERNGRTGSMEIRLPLPPEQQQSDRRESPGSIKEPSPVVAP